MQPPVTLVSFKVSSSSPEFQGVALGGEAPSISRCGEAFVQKRVADLRFTACSRVAMGSRHVRGKIFGEI